MKKVIGILIFIISLVSLSGCAFIDAQIRAKNTPPSSIEIEGEEYVTGFYNNLFAVGVSYREPETCLFTKSPYSWWHLGDGLFDMYCCEHVDSMWWHPTLYCKKSQVEEVKNYYLDIENYDYYIGLYGGEPIQLSDDLNRSNAENAISLILKDDSYRRKTLRRVTYNITINEYERFIFYRKSKDGLFTTVHESLIYYQNNIYLMNYEDGSKNVTHLYIPPERFNEYLCSLLQEYNLIEFN